tara:strand:+ start:485 stop:841 length:357 start_codon:yes stop_codon:yes gene_type:complete
MTILMIAFGGALGASSRYFISSFLNNYSILSFTLGTLVVNVIGCFFIGFYISETSEVISENIKNFLIIGFLGSFTTFSAFTKESVELYQAFGVTNSFLYISVNVLLCLSVTYLGYKIS